MMTSHFNCKTCGALTEKKEIHTSGRYCKTCYNKDQKRRYQNINVDYDFLNEGMFTPKMLTRMPW